jgi:two-component system response regulator HydG
MNPKLHILLIDDDQRMTRTLADILSLDGYETIQASSGKMALELAQKMKFDCALTDIRMPDMNGVEVLQALRQMQPDLPVALMTAYAHEEILRIGMQSGAAGVLEKPLDIDLLLQFCTDLQWTRSIAIVDDDPNFCATLGDILARRGFSVTKITDPRQVMGLFSEHAQIVLLDMKLNAADGYDVLKEIRQQYPRMPVLLITGYREEMAISIQRALDLQVYACLYKPLEIENLLQILRNIQIAQTHQTLAGK